MARSSLNKFTVPLASDQSAVSQGLLMIKRKHLFRVVFEGFGITTPKSELTKNVVDFTRPTLTFDEIQLDVYNSKVFLAGKHTWDPVTVNIRDDVNGNVSRLVGEQVQKQFDMLEQASAASGIDYKFTTRCEMLDGGNGDQAENVLESWLLYGCFLTNINYNEVAYATSDPAMVSMTIRYDNAVQTPIGSGIGNTAARTIGDLATGG